MKKGLLTFLVCTLLGSSPAYALTGFSLGSAASLTQQQVNNLVRVVGLGADHRDYQSATPLGWKLGLDLGAEVSLIGLPTDFQNALSTLSSEAAATTSIPVVRLNAHKGLLGGVDLGLSWIGLGVLNAYNRILGISAQWAFFQSRISAPSLAVRGSYTAITLPAIFTNATTWKFDLVASKNMGIIDPYFGAGAQILSGALDVPVGGVNGLAVGVTAAVEQVAPHLFVGIPIRLSIMRGTFEYDYSFAGISTYGAKIGFAF